MDDLTQYLYEFLMERCMRDLREDAEYNACISAVLQQEEQVRAGLNPEQQSQLDCFIDQILEQEYLEREHQFRAALGLVRELSALVRA